MKRRGGFFFIDVMTALALLGVIGSVLMVAVNRQHGATERLGATRAAGRRAEMALIALQAHRPIPKDDQPPVRVDRISGRAPAGERWVRVTASVRDAHGVAREASLVGMTPE